MASRLEECRPRFQNLEAKVSLKSMKGHLLLALGDGNDVNTKTRFGNGMGAEPAWPLCDVDQPKGAGG
jgi:hypothetical protein